MIFTLNKLKEIYPEQLWLELSAQEQDYAWQHTASQAYSNAAARWRAFVNFLCLNTFLTWLKADSDLTETPSTWPQATELPSFWDVANGTGLTLGATRLVLIPSDKGNLPEFRIPQEWVDIPDWAANYYLAMQLNLEERWLRVWGYITHQQIRQEATYDPMDRTYCINQEDLIQDLNVMWVARELSPPRQPEVKPLLTFPAETVKKLLDQLGKWTPYSPRLDVTFEQWAVLMASAESRQHLYQLRQDNQKRDRTVTVAESNPSVVNNLSQWLHNRFEAGWQPLDALFTPQHKTLAVQFRSDAALNEVCVKGAKLIDLGIQLGGTTVVLLVGLTPVIDNKISIRVQLHPIIGETYLPPNLRLVLLSQSGTALQEVQSRLHDNYIQLKRFKSPVGKHFSIHVALGDVSIKESFVLKPLAS
ncbi:MAG TPA: DUF1822 family protein [Waterburya sp.]